MEAKLLASVFSFLSIFLAIYAQSSGNTDNDDGVIEVEYETAIYYGDSSVNIGEPFAIACIVPITDPIFWLKDNEPITRHNLRHGRDEHAYVMSENAIEGEKHKIEAHMSVRHALKVHEGKYQCNNLHTSYHTLHVRNVVFVPKPHTKSPFIITANNHHHETPEFYETVPELATSESSGRDSREDVFTRTWDPVTALLPAPQTTVTMTSSGAPQRPRHHHDAEQLPKEQLQERQHGHPKFIYINASNFDGSPRPYGSADGNGPSGRLHLAHMPPTQQFDAFTPLPDERGHAKHHSALHLPPSMRNASGSSATTLIPPPVVTFYAAAPASSSTAYNEQNSIDPYSQATNNQYQQVVVSTTPIMYPTVLAPFQPRIQTHTPHHGHRTVAMPPLDAMTLPHAARPTSISLLPPMVAIAATTAILQTKEQDFLVPNYDNAEHQYKFFEIRSPLVLSCNITKDGNYELTWQKNGTDIAKVKELEGRYKIIAAERKFIIDRTDINDDGLYSCVANNQRRDINVIAHVAVRVPSNTGVVEGEKLSIVCTFVGTDPQLSWTIGNLTITNSTERYILKPDDNQVQNAILTMENASLDDRGEYKCIGRNAANIYGEIADASDVSYVRVKGKLAALWPFLGICAEVLILCTIILIYERRRNKNEPDESDTDPQEQHGLVH